MTATGVLGSDPTKVNVAGDIMTGPLILSGDPVTGLGAATKHYVDTHGGGGGGTTIFIVTTGPITSGDLTVSAGSFVQVGTDLTVQAAAGDVLQLVGDLVVNSSGAQMQFEAATRVSGADNRYWSSGTNTSLYPGGKPSWIVDPNLFHGPRDGFYRVNADDVVAGNVTVRYYARVPSASRSIFQDASYPLQLWLINLGAGT